MKARERKKEKKHEQNNEEGSQEEEGEKKRSLPVKKLLAIRPHGFNNKEPFL
jgi:hypothetical protein